VTVHREQIVKRERKNQQDTTIRCLLSTLSQHVSGIIMPIFRRTKTVCYCMWCAALRCITQPSHQTGTTHASVHPLPIHQTWKTYEAGTSPTLRHTHLHTTFTHTHKVPTRFTTHYTTKKTLQLISTFFPACYSAAHHISNTRSLFSWRWA